MASIRRTNHVRSGSAQQLTTRDIGARESGHECRQLPGDDRVDRHCDSSRVSRFERIRIPRHRHRRGHLLASLMLVVHFLFSLVLASFSESDFKKVASNPYAT